MQRQVCINGISMIPSLSNRVIIIYRLENPEFIMRKPKIMSAVLIKQKIQLQ